MDYRKTKPVKNDPMEDKENISPFELSRSLVSEVALDPVLPLEKDYTEFDEYQLVIERSKVQVKSLDSLPLTKEDDEYNLNYTKDYWRTIPSSFEEYGMPVFVRLLNTEF
jgi:hypothetical protein